MADTPPEGPRRVPSPPTGTTSVDHPRRVRAGRARRGVAVDALLGRPGAAVLDAGCGTGRVAIELTRAATRRRDRRRPPSSSTPPRPSSRTHLDRRRPRAPRARRRTGAVRRRGPRRQRMIFVARGTEAAVLATVAARLRARRLRGRRLPTLGATPARGVRRPRARPRVWCSTRAGRPGTARRGQDPVTTRSAFNNPRREAVAHPRSVKEVTGRPGSGSSLRRTFAMCTRRYAVSSWYSGPQTS